MWLEGKYFHARGALLVQGRCTEVGEKELGMRVDDIFTIISLFNNYYSHVGHLGHV